MALGVASRDYNLQGFVDTALFRCIARLLILTQLLWGVPAYAQAPPSNPPPNLVTTLADPASSLHLGSYRQTAVTRFTRTVFDFTYTATIGNSSDQTYGNVRATLTSLIPATTVMDGELSFGTVGGLQSVNSQDSFTIRQDRTIPFDASKLVWTVKANSQPVANPGNDRTVQVGIEVSLDGSQSSDPDGDTLTVYRWQLLQSPADSGVILTDADTPKPGFTVTKPGLYRFQLIVNDGNLDSTPAIVNISTSNSPPVADAGQDQHVDLGSTVTLDGSHSTDIDGNPLSYAWAFLEKPPNSQSALYNPAQPTDGTTNTPQPQFAVDLPGTYRIRLIVNDGQVDSAADIVIVGTNNAKPVANAGQPQTVGVGDTVNLSGLLSKDPEGADLTYRWSFAHKPDGSAASLQNDTTAQPWFKVDLFGDYVAQLIVSDGTLDSLPSTVGITTENSPPIADAGLDRSATLGDIIPLDGTASRDPDGDTLNYAWSVTHAPVGSSAAISPPTDAQPNFTPDKEGGYVVQLLVRDTHNATSTATFNLTVNPKPNRQPHITSTPPPTGTVNQSYGYAVNATDPDTNDTLTYSLTQAPEGMGINPSTGLIAWTPNTAQVGNQTITVKVQDNGGLSDSQSFTILVSATNRAPTIISTAVATATDGQLYAYAVHATDPDIGDVLSYVLTESPSGMGIDGVNGLIQWIPIAAGDYPVTVSVNDGHGGTVAQQFTVAVANANHPPSIISLAPTTATIGQSYAYPVLATDQDAGDTLTYFLALAPTGMSVDPSSGAISWTPAANQIGLQSATVEVSDGRGGLASQSFSVQVSVPFNPDNLAPVAVGNSYSIRADQTLTVAATGVLGNDTDPNGDLLTALKLTDPAKGSLSFTSDGALSFTPNQAALSCPGNPTPTGVVFDEPKPLLGVSAEYYNTFATVGVAKGDFNHDGMLDLALTQVGYAPGWFSRVAVMLGQGNGSFLPLTVLYTAGQLDPKSDASLAILAKDFDGDKALDLVVTMGTLRQLLFFKGRGDGTFATALVIPSTYRDGQVQTADLNGDQSLDLVTTSYLDGKVSVYFNQGAGSFQSPVVVATVASTNNLALGDTNGDGAADIVFAAFRTINSLVNKNDGTGGFLPLKTLATQGISGLYLADFTGDKKLDVVLAGDTCQLYGQAYFNSIASSYGSMCIALLPGNGDGSFALPSSQNLEGLLDQGVNLWSENVAPDINADGKPDVVFVSYGTNNYAYVGLNNGTGKFTVSNWIASSGPPPFPATHDELVDSYAPFSFMPGDFTGDGVQDLIVVGGDYRGSSRHAMSLLEGATPGTFHAPRGGIMGRFTVTGSNPREVDLLLNSGWPDGAVGDFTNDGQPEMVVPTTNNGPALSGVSGSLFLVPILADGRFGQATVALPWIGGGASWRYYHLHTGDFDRDGNLDVAYLGANGGGYPQLAIVAYGDGTGHFTPVSIPYPYSGPSPNNLAVGDFNADGFADLALTFANGTIEIQRNNGVARSFSLVGTARTAVTGLNDTNPGIVAADVDRDGLLDLIANLGGQSSSVIQQTQFFKGHGDGAFDAGVTINPSNPLSVGGVTDYAAADFNRDGKLDLVGNTFWGTAHVQLGNGDGSFQVPVSYVSPGSGGGVDSVNIADFDRDGFLDLVFAGNTYGYNGQPPRGVMVYPGKGDGSFGNGRRFAVGTQAVSNPLITDVNRDGKPDLIVSNWSSAGTFASILVNNADSGRLCKQSDSFTYRASDGALNSNATTINLTINPLNHAPIITSSPVTTADSGHPYVYGVQAGDQDGGVLNFALIHAPAGMGIDDMTGFISWLPLSNQTGNQTVTVRVYDDYGQYGEQTFTVEVITQVPMPNVAGLSLAAAQAAILAAGLVVGPITTKPSATVPAGNVISTSPSITGTVPSGTPVNLLVSSGVPTIANLDYIAVKPDSPAILSGTAQAFTATAVLKDGSSLDLTDAVLWVSSNTNAATMNASGIATGVANGVATITATLGVTIGSAQLTVKDKVTGDTELPTAEISAPIAGAEVTSPADIVGSATDANFFQYELAYAPAGESNFTVLSNSATPVANGVLGKLDPTLLINDLYTLRLTVTDLSGNQSIAETTVQVSRDMKIGLFSLTFQDLNIPVSGIPITINRTYDSRDKGQGDFGVGWRLGIQSLRIRPNRAQGSGWMVNRGGSIISVYSLAPLGEHKVSLTLPGGKVETFDLAISPASSVVVPFSGGLTASYVPRTGTLGKLALLSNNSLLIADQQPGPVLLLDDDTLDTFNPTRFRYTSVDGQIIDIDRTKGVEKVQDTNGNSLTFGTNGITHSSGKSIAFTRDSQGRISLITDLQGRVQSYAYDENGDLTAYTDQTGGITRFNYARNHYLLDIINANGIRATRNEYDVDGRLVATTDPNGARVTYEHDLANHQDIRHEPDGTQRVYGYDGQGNITTEADPMGHLTQRSYDDNGFLLTETNPLGQTISFTYDNQGHETSRTNALGNITRHSYGTAGKITSETDPLGNTTVFTLDAHGNRLSQRDAQGNTTAYTYNLAGNLLSVTDPKGQVTRYEYDAFGRRTKNINALGHQTLATYDANGNPMEIKLQRTAPSGPQSLTYSLRHDAKGSLLSVTSPEGDISRNEYDALGNLITTIDPLNRRTAYLYDVSGRRTGAQLPDGTVMASQYDDKGQAIRMPDRNGLTVGAQYDASSNLTKLIMPDNTPADDTDNPTQQLTYDAARHLRSLMNEAGNVLTFDYDAAGRIIRRSDAFGTNTATYDAAGQVIAQTDALGRTTHFTLDALGRVIETTLPEGSVERIAYDAVGNIVSKTDPTGKTTHFEYDALNRLSAVVDAAGARTEYRLDEWGNLLSQKDANGHETRFEYDNRKLRTATILPSGQRETRHYDAGGRLTSVTDFNGNTIQMTYDALSRLTEKQYPNGTSVQFAYTLLNNLQSMADARGTTTFAYDGQGHLVSRSEPDGRTITYAYNAANSLASITSPTGTTRYAYDAAQRPTTVTDAEGGMTRYQYDAVGNLTQTEFPNQVTETRAYNARNFLTQLTTQDQTHQIISSFVSTFDATGNQLTVEEQNGRGVSYAYDALSRLTREQVTLTSGAVRTIGYTYDAVGNRLTRNDSGEGLTTYSYDANDRLSLERLNGINTQYGYDNNGNRLSQTRSPTDKYQYQWDFDNRLLGVTQTAGAATHTSSNGFDAAGTRVSQTVDGVESRYLVDTNRDNAQIIEEYTPQGETLASYALGKQRVSRRTSSGRVYYHHDILGSTRALTNHLGAIVGNTTYDAYGKVLQASGSIQPFQFTGEQVDPVSDLTYLRARFLDRHSGQFMSADPFPGIPQRPISLNHYLYADGNPVNSTDPSGFTTLSEVLTVTFMIGTMAAIAQGTRGLMAVATRDVTIWEGPTLQVTGAIEGVFSAGIGFTALSAKASEGNTTYRDRHLLLLLGIATPNPLEKLAKAAPVKGGFPAFAQEYLPLAPVDFQIGSSTLNAPNNMGTDGSALSGSYLNVGCSISAGSYAGLLSLYVGTFQSAVGVSAIIQGFSVGTSVPDKTYTFNPNASCGITTGVSLPLGVTEDSN
jgi:RHS repeat-associated protein